MLETKWILACVIPLGISLAAAGCGSGTVGGDDDDDDNHHDDGGTPGEPDATPFVCDSTATGGVTFEKIATWRDDVVAAYSMIHDDMCDPGVRGIHENAIPALRARGVVAGLGPFIQACDEENLWPTVLDAEAKGNEIISHSYTHPEISTGNAAHEVVEAKAAFDEHLVNPVTFFIFPYDYFTAQTIAAVGSAGHIGARAGNRDDNNGADLPPINSADPGSDLEVEFDVWPRNYSKYARYFEKDVLNIHVFRAIEKGGWAVREFHSVITDDAPVEGNGFGPVRLSNYTDHLDFLVNAWAAGKVWTATPSTVIKYRHARSTCGASVAADTVTFDTSNPDCVKFHTPISVIVKTGDDLNGLSGTQGGAEVPVRKLSANTFSVTADPTLGEVALAGCTNDGPTVDPGIQLPPIPTPAASVCEIETVTGVGGHGKMDDLERPEAEFQVLPNPSQEDGRTGTWSWYPQNVSVAMAADGGSNHVLHYTGTGVNAWTGVTLAFLGGNGAGSCYNATAYQGIRFRIKGSVAATDELNGKIIVSMVTAETQTQNYGGDLNGEGGHFHKVIPVTSSWQTVSIGWSQFDVPTWGSTTTLTALAKAKLQAIDWGISNTATTFDVSIDDVELY